MTSCHFKPRSPVPNQAPIPAKTYRDYYPFGMEMPGRCYEAGDYRFGFNGKEADQEAVTAGSQYDYGFRIYNTAIARFLSVDPLTKDYPSLTPFQFASNSPIIAIDLDGLEAWVANKTKWSPEDIEGYFNYAKPQLEKYMADNVERDCADMAVLLLINYASSRNLPVVLETYIGQIDNSMKVISGRRIASPDDFIRVSRNSIDTKNLLRNSVVISNDEARSGDFKVYNSAHTGNPYHTVVFFDPAVGGNQTTISASPGREIYTDDDYGAAYSASGSGNSNRWDFAKFQLDITKVSATDMTDDVKLTETEK
jgi:RHS repeat-associated protein